jgi:hypothetical protein
VSTGDTLRLTAQAVDASGQPVPNARIRFSGQGARFEGSVDSLGLVTAGATGTIPVAVVALVPGVRPVVHRVDVQMVPGPAARIELLPAAPRLALGQRLRLAARVLSRVNDERPGDRVTWKSSAPAVARVDNDGMVTAVAAGRATLTASSGAASSSAAVDVMPTTIATLELTPSRQEARQGDAIRFTATGRDARGKAITGLTTAWSFAPGQGKIEQDGLFVGYEPGEYVVTATQGTRVAHAVVRLTDRDVRRPMQVVGRLPRTRSAPRRSGFILTGSTPTSGAAAAAT